MTEFTVQCEACGENTPESEAYLAEYPGATVAFCEECTDDDAGYA